MVNVVNKSESGKHHIIRLTVRVLAHRFSNFRVFYFFKMLFSLRTTVRLTKLGTAP